MKSFKEFAALNEGMSVGDWIYQRGSDFESWGILLEPQKNGGFKAAVFTSTGGSLAGQAKMKSTKGWYPAPKVIKVDEVPDKVLKKIKDKAGM
jgi:hypothetical protein